MKIVVLSCDKNDDTFEPFHHCLEKYYINHPEVIYFTETKKNPYYKTICKNYPLNQWSKRIRESLQEVDDNKILIMVDDVFIRKPVDEERINYACDNLKGNIALMNFELAFDSTDLGTDLIGWKKRRHGSSYEVSILCGLWQKDKLITLLSDEDCDPWRVEYAQRNHGFDFLINSGDYIIDWGYKTWIFTGIQKSKWCRNVVPFFESEGIKIDYEKRGFVDET